MSYLLKALKKAEEERSRVESGQDDKQVVLTNHASTLPAWLVLVVISLLGLTAGKMLFFGNPHTADEEHYGNTRVSEINKTEFSEQFSAQAVISPESYGQYPDHEKQIIGEGGKSGVPESIEPDITPKTLAQLSKPILNQIPSLSLESHMYSSVSEYSSVIINGQAYNEGSYLDSNIILKHINADGIVISVGNHLVALPKGITWVSTYHAK